MKHLLVLAILLLCIPLAAAVASPSQPAETTGTVVLQQGLNGYMGSSTATLDRWQPDVPVSPSSNVFLLRSTTYSSLVRFDLTGVPSGAYITRATLSLFSVERSVVESLPLQVFRALRPWQPDQATWHQAMSGNTWERIGAREPYIDRSDIAVASALITATDTFYDIDVTGITRSWLQDPGKNHGFLLEPLESNVIYKLASERWAEPAKRLKLTIDYSMDTAHDFPPLVSIAAPIHDSFVEGITPLRCETSDDRALQRVDFSVDGVPLGSGAPADCTFAWDTSAWAVGSHRLLARAVDSAGQASEDAIIVHVYRMDHGVVTIAQISDVHVGEPYLGSPPDPALNSNRFQQALAELDTVVQPAVIINTGDLVNISNEPSFRIYSRLAAASKIPIRAIAGNHDQSRPGTASDDNFLYYVGRLDPTFDIGAHRYAGFSSYLLHATPLASRLSSTTKKGIVFSHYLLRLPQGSSEPASFYTMYMTETTALEQLMVAAGASAYLSGHYHEPFLLTESAGRIAEIGAPSLGAKAQYEIITTDDGVIASSVHQLGEWPEIVITRPQRWITDGGTQAVGGNVPIRAKVYGDAAVSSVSYAVDGAPRGAMADLGGNVWQAWWDTALLPAGIHTVTVTAVDTRARSRQVVIAVKVAPPPEVDFSASATSGPTPLTISFTSQVTGSISGYLWSFGDGVTSTATSPVHTYRTPGEYTVTLAAGGPAGAGSVVKAGYINAGDFRGYSFDDVPPSDPAQPYIETIYARGVTAGCSLEPPLFCPTGIVSRDQIAVFVDRAMGWAPAPAGVNVFTDLANDYWATPFAETLRAHGVTAGCQSPGEPLQYCPYGQLTKAEIVTMIVRAAGWPVSGATGLFADSPVGTWHAPFVEAFYAQSPGTDCGQTAAGQLLFCPDALVSRAYMAEMLVKSFGF